MSNSRINISQQQQTTRRYFGIVTVIITVILSSLAIINDWDLLLAGVIIFLLYLTGVLMLLEDRYEVCAVNAMRNMESMTGRLSLGQEKIGEDDKFPVFEKNECSRTLGSKTFRSAKKGRDDT